STWEFGCRNDRRRTVACNKVAERRQVSGSIQRRLEVVVARRAIVVMMHIVFARPEQLHRNARQTLFCAFVGNESGNLRNLDIVLTDEAPAESTARPNQMERDVAVLNAGRYGSIRNLRNLAW